MEAAASAFIGTACTKTVMGEHLFEKYKSYLSENSVKNIKIFKSNTKFKFGDGEQVTATKRVILPAYIAGKHCEIDVKIVNENIPLLLSKTSLKWCNAILDMINDKATIFGKEVDLHFSTSGH